jgi:hypothetical protein
MTGLATTLRAKRCSIRKGGCGGMFTPFRPLQSACSPKCAQAFAAASSLKAMLSAKRQDMRHTRAQLEEMKTVPMLKREAQGAFNAWVRLRDATLPCISCGALPPDLSSLHAGRDAGHYRSTGSADHLRFDEDNVHGQCVRCNQWGAGMVVDYRLGLIRRIGLARVEALEAKHATHKWTRDGLRKTRDHYRAEVSRLKKGST